MTFFEDMVQGAAWDDRVRVMGESVADATITYHEDGGAGVAIDGIWRPNQTMPEYYPDGQQNVTPGVLRVLPSDLPNIDVDTDYFTIDGTKYGIVMIGRKTPYMDVQLESRAHERVGGTNSRIQR